MKTRLPLLIVLTSCFAASSAAQQSPKRQISANPVVDADSLAIYRDFLKSRNNGGGPPLNYIAEWTVPFEPDALDYKGCLRDFQASDFSSRTTHRFAVDTFPPPRKVVDPARQKQWLEDAAKEGAATCFFVFSEIVFDSSRTHGALSLSVYCGSQGSGERVVYEKQNGVWNLAKPCGSWN